jgi:hypothetical protein
MNTLTIYADKSLLTILFLFCKSDLQQFVLHFFCSSTGLLCISFFCHSALLLLCLSFFFSSPFPLISFCTSIEISCSTFSPFSFITVSFFFFSEQPSIQSHSFSFIHDSLTIPLPLPMGNPRTSVLATETLTNSSSSVRFT